ncbi:MAG: FAD-dependent oxidoreductase [Planctomycetaceae bacterium]|nr:FAD-dependent oxidoreductase [Planctomycetaceae bacterium]
MNTRPPNSLPPLARLALVAAVFALGTATHGAENPPHEGLALRLDAGQGVDQRDGRVVAWHDLSPWQHVAKAPDRFAEPTVDTEHPALCFTNESLLRIDTRILPAETREFTILAVGQADAAPSVGLLSIRNAAVPLIQLDVDENTNTRFVLRDTQSRTLTASTRCILGAKTIFGGILFRKDAEAGQTEVLFGAEVEPGTTSRFASPLADSGAWIGGLVIPGRNPLFWKGTISEILVYNRALDHEELKQVTAYLTEKHNLKDPAAPLDDSWNILTSPHPQGPVTKEIETDVCVVGAGSGGIAAALAAARRGAHVVLIERQARLGGTGTNAYVANWEPGPGCSLAKEIFDRMQAAGGVGVARGYPVETKAPMGYSLVTDGIPYEATLRRSGIPSSEFRRIPYKPEIFDRVARDMLDETGNVALLDRTTFFQADTNPDGSRVDSILAQTAGGTVLRVRAKVFVDSTGCVWLCRALGCDVMLGADPRSRFNEPSAPEKGLLQLNAISRCYLIRPSDAPRLEPAPSEEVRFPKCAFVTGWKDGLQAVNTLPLLPGRALIDFGYDECLRRSEQMVHAHWHWLQQMPEFQGYELEEIAPMLGIRESYRVVTRYVLNEHDLVAGLPGQKHTDFIAVADHPCDVHGAGGHLVEVKTAYGIPYRCLIPAGPWQNLLVACRGAGFSKIAASSCRLQRTMIQLGHAAGAAAAMAAKDNLPVDKIDVNTLVKQLDAPSRDPY